MKFKTTKKAIKKNYSNIIKIGYCNMQSLLNYKTPFAYSAGESGWACDYYNIDGVIISTGYQPIGKSVDYDFLMSYEKKARDANGIEEVNKILDDFIKAVKMEVLSK